MKQIMLQNCGWETSELKIKDIEGKVNISNRSKPYAIFPSSIGKKYLFIDIYSEKNTAIKEPNKLNWLYKVFVIEFITDCLKQMQ